jgi:hypothetical protein
MPYVYQAPELVLEHEGLKVYHAYDDEGRQRFYWYSTAFDEDLRFNFDIRDTYKKILESGIRGWVSISKLSAHNEKHHPKMLKFAIRHEMLIFPEGS